MTLQEEQMDPAHPYMPRRRVLRWALGVGGLTLLAACGPSSQSASKPTTSGTPNVAAAAVSLTAAPDSPRTTLTPTTGRPKRGGVLKAQRQNNWATHDPHLAQTGSTDLPLVFDYLTRLDRNPVSGAFEVRPSLAESWELPDPTTVVFKLRPGVKFHDGTDCDAAAVKWNLERLATHPQSGGKNHTASIAGVEAVDARTVRLTLKAPNPVLFVNLSNDADSVGGIMSPTHWQKVGDAGVAKEPVGSGPFRMVDYRPGSVATYRRFDTYWKTGADGQPLPYLDEVQIIFQQDSSAALLQLRAGDLDVISTIAGRDVAGVKSNPALSYLELLWQSSQYCLCFNARPGSRFAGEQMKKVRQAVFQAIDRDAVARTIGLGLGEANYYHSLPGSIGYSDQVPRYTYDPAKAKQLLAEAGFAEGLDVQLDFISRPEDTQNAQIYQQMLGQVGIRLILQPFERVAWVERTLSGSFEFASFISGTRPDPDLVLGYRFGAAGAGNYSAWVHPDVEAALSEGRSTYDSARRQAAYEKVQAAVHADAYYGFIWRRRGTVASTSALKDFEPPLSNLFNNSTEVWLDR
jgi:peptide/nickel transport system substrate-binding protein